MQQVADLVGGEAGRQLEVGGAGALDEGGAFLLGGGRARGWREERGCEDQGGNGGDGERAVVHRR